MSDNLLTAPRAEADRISRNRRLKRVQEANEEAEAQLIRKHLEREVKAASERHFRILRALLKSGEKDSLFGGFNGDGGKWDEDILRNPEDWVWVRAKYGAIGIPYPDGSEYCFPPGAVFPLHLDFKEYVHTTMNGEIREVKV